MEKNYGKTINLEGHILYKGREIMENTNIVFAQNGQSFVQNCQYQ
jgi:hypothetical protein